MLVEETVQTVGIGIWGGEGGGGGGEGGEGEVQGEGIERWKLNWKDKKSRYSLLRFPSSCESSLVLEVSDLLVLQGRKKKIISQLCIHDKFCSHM